MKDTQEGTGIMDKHLCCDQLMHRDQHARHFLKKKKITSCQPQSDVQKTKQPNVQEAVTPSSFHCLSPLRWEGGQPGERSGDENNSGELAECLGFCGAELSLPEDKPRAQILGFHNMHHNKRETSWIQFQCRHYFLCIEKQQNCYILAKLWGKAPKTFYILFLKSQGSSRIILQRKTEHLGGKKTFLRTAKSRTARNNCQTQINNSKKQLLELSDSKISQD